MFEMTHACFTQVLEMGISHPEDIFCATYKPIFTSHSQSFENNSSHSKSVESFLLNNHEFH